MIEFISGTIKSINEQTITVLTSGGIGLAFQTPRPELFTKGSNVELHTYMHWNSENGPSLFAFQTEVERATFLLIISCPQIGPKIGLSCLSQAQAPDLLAAIAAGEKSILVKANGVSDKKAETIISHLRDKTAKLISSGKLEARSSNFIDWHNLHEALTSLGYKKPEISKATQYLAAECKEEAVPFDKLLRKALAYLSVK
jgi:Holliday junction DNA helicase RuvA subunit